MKIDKKNINKMLKNINMKPKELAKKLKINPRTVERWCSGKQSIPRNNDLY